MQFRVKNKHRKNQQAGFTLLETCISLVVMMIGGLGIAAVFAFAIKNNTGARDRAAAIAVAQQELERLRNLPFKDAALNATVGTVTPVVVSSGGRSYSLRTTIQNTTPTVKTIWIEVTPQNSSDPWARNSVQLTTERAAFTVGPYVGGP